MIDLRKMSKEDYFRIGVYATCLALSGESDSEDGAQYYLDASWMFRGGVDHDVATELYMAFASEIVYRHSHDEYYYQELLKKHASKLLGSWRVVAKKNDGCNIPDAWVRMDGDLYPVEVKLGHFGDSAMRQLFRYMDAYGAKCGVAVGASIDEDHLPDNIFFVNLDELEEMEYYEKRQNPTD